MDGRKPGPDETFRADPHAIANGLPVALDEVEKMTAGIDDDRSWPLARGIGDNRACESGIGMKGGPDNPIGARAMYLWQGNKDTLYRIHGTNEPWTIGTNVSSGCIRLTNDDVVDLYNRISIGTKVVVLATAKPTAAAQ